MVIILIESNIRSMPGILMFNRLHIEMLEVRFLSKHTFNFKPSLIAIRKIKNRNEIML